MAKKRKVIRKLVKPFSSQGVADQTADIITNVFKVKSRDILSGLTRGNLTREQMVEALQDTIDKSEAQLRTIVDTGLSIVGRERINEVAKDLGLTHYKYIGGVIQTSRDFCIERDGGVYTKDEVEGWADEDWDGKIPGTNEETIFSYVGGYNCRHSLIPILDPDEFN